MYISSQKKLPLEARSEHRGIMIILAGRNLGLGALIQSTVNSIWLAKKLGKVPYIWWGKSCLYTNKSTGGNTYPKFFHAHQDHLDLELSKYNLIYPSIWSSITLDDTLDELDNKAHSLVISPELEFKLEDRDFLTASDLCIVYQYLSSDLAQQLSGKNVIDPYEDKFHKECDEIFNHYFKPHKIIEESANAIWNQTFKTQLSVLGIHCRATDKIVEHPLPSPHHYIKAARKLVIQQKFSAFFIATDSLLALNEIQSQLHKFGIVGTQDIKRSNGKSGIHFNPNGAFENGIEMLIDIELLCKCKVVLGFPGSQIYWWLSRKRNAENIDFTLLPVKAGTFNWFFAVFFILRTQGWTGLIQYLRMQKGGLKSLFLGFIRKAYKK
jgi:hypothetical protein